MRLLCLFLVLLPYSIAISQNLSHIFAPYITASASYRHSKSSAAISPTTASHHRFTPAPNSSRLSEEEARLLMLARPPGPAYTKDKQKPYARGSTHVPTVDLHKPSHSITNAAQTALALRQNLSSSASPSSVNVSYERPIAHFSNRSDRVEIPVDTARELSASTLQLNHTAKYPDVLQSAAEIEARTVHLPAHGSKLHTNAVSESETLVENGAFGISLLLPLAALTSVVWLVALVTRRYAACGAGPQHTARMLRKRLISLRDMHV